MNLEDYQNNLVKISKEMNSWAISWHDPYLIEKLQLRCFCLIIQAGSVVPYTGA